MLSQSCDYLSFYLWQGGYVSVYLSDCEQTNSKSYEQMLMKFSESVDNGPDDYTLVMFWIPGGLWPLISKDKRPRSKAKSSDRKGT